MDKCSIPVFPLNAVLFPDGSLPLRIFEPRYLDMITHCLKSGQGFGVCLIREGAETGLAAEVYDVGTLSEISYFNMRPDGVLGITAQGVQRFCIDSVSVSTNQLVHATVEYISNESPETIPEHLTMTALILKKLLDQLGHPYIKMKREYNNATWVGSRLAEILPISLQQKQHLLEMTQPVDRLECIWKLLQELKLK